MSSRIKTRRAARAPLSPSKRARIEQALGEGDILRAARLAEAALAAGQADPMLFNLAAWRREEEGDYRGAHRLLQKALEMSPGDVLVLGAIGAVLRKEGRLEEALAVLDQALAAEPRHTAAWLERGYALEDLRLHAAAEESFRRAVSLDPALAPALGKLADAAARRGDTEAAAGLARRALSADPLEPSATFAVAVMEIEAKDFESAEARLRRLLACRLKHDDHTRSLTLLGDTLDRLGRTQEAFAAWSEAQAIFRAEYAAVFAPSAERPTHRGFVERIAAQVAAAPVPASAAPPEPVPGAAARHVFLLGYPRSGTTLVENVLASAPDTVALEERETFAPVDPVLLPNSGMMPDLDALGPDKLNEFRTLYWAQVKRLGADVEGRTFVDMNPFNNVKLPVIARLFPDARILIMRRDPRDVVLSCFRVNFVPSPGTYSFSDLEETARHYDATMKLTELCKERLPLAFHEVRYDRLVADFEPTVRAMAEFVGLEWTDAFRRFDKTARTRGVRTASQTQVRQGLYDGGGRWRRYEEQLAPVLPILQPWVERSGFPE